MKVFSLLTIVFFLLPDQNPAAAAFQPPRSTEESLNGKLIIVPGLQLNASSINPNVPVIKGKRQAALKQRLIAKLLRFPLARKLMGIDEPTTKQRKLGKLSLIFAVSAILLIVIPYATLAIPVVFGIASFPLAVAGLVLGIKSIKGNSNTMGLVGLILSAALLLLMILSVLFLAILFGNWN